MADSLINSSFLYYNMVRFVGNDTVIINDYLETDGYSESFINRLKRSLELKGIRVCGTLPYRAFTRKNKDGLYTATGCYINYLETPGLIVFPSFGIEEDEAAFRSIRSYFPSGKIVQLGCSEIAEQSGVLNCVSWN